MVICVPDRKAILTDQIRSLDWKARKGKFICKIQPIILKRPWGNLRSCFLKTKVSPPINGLILTLSQQGELEDILVPIEQRNYSRRKV